MKPFSTLATTCVNSTAEKIDTMTAQARQVRNQAAVKVWIESKKAEA